MKVFKVSLYFVVILFLNCGRSKVVDSEFSEAAKAYNAYARAIEENSTDCNKMADALQKPVENLVKITAKIISKSKDKKLLESSKELTSAQDRVDATSKLLIQCARHPRIIKLLSKFSDLPLEKY